MTVDLIVENIESSAKGSMLGILEFIEEDLIRIEFSQLEDRPTNFSNSPNEDQQILRKAKEN